MGTVADRTIDALNDESRKLLAVLDGLGPDELTRGSAATEWTVAQVLSHLGSGAEIGLAALEATLGGGERPGPEFNQSVWAKWDALSPAEQAADFRAANARLLARYDAIDAETRESLRIDLGFLPQPVDLATAVGLRLGEFALHSWDVRAAFDPHATVDGTVAELVLDTMAPMFGFLAKPDRLDRPVRLAVRTTDPDRSFGLILDGTLTLTELPADADGVLTAPTEYWLRLVTGRHAPAHTPDSVTATGDGVSLADLRKAFPGY